MPPCSQTREKTRAPPVDDPSTLHGPCDGLPATTRPRTLDRVPDRGRVEAGNDVVQITWLITERTSGHAGSAVPSSVSILRRGQINQLLTCEVIAMPRNRPIILIESDFALLHRLAGHPNLAAELKKAVVVESRLVPPDVVTMNSRVRFEDETTGECRDVTIVFPQQVNASMGLISVLTPVGTALLGLTVGQSIAWPFPDGTQHCLRVLKLIDQPEAVDPPGQRVVAGQRARDPG